MITFRRFTAADAAAVRELLYPDMAPEQISEMIDQWNEGFFDGKAFHMFAVLSDGDIVGTVSLFEQEGKCASFGIEIGKPFRRRGIATGAGELALQEAARLGYRTVVSQVRQDNAASIALHRKLGFLLKEEAVNRKGKAVFLYEKTL